MKGYPKQVPQANPVATAVLGAAEKAGLMIVGGKCTDRQMPRDQVAAADRHDLRLTEQKSVCARLPGKPLPNEGPLVPMPQYNRDLAAAVLDNEVEVAAAGFEEPRGCVGVVPDQIVGSPAADVFWHAMDQCRLR